VPNWDEHTEYQSIINVILAKITMNPLIFFVSGIIQHWILDNLIEERPINIHSDNINQEIMSLMLNITGIILMFSINVPFVFKIALFASILPDILEGLRLLISKDGYNLWMKGDSQRFHINLHIKSLINTKDDFYKDITRRIIVLIIVVVILS